MPSYAKSNPPPWNESDSFPETTLHLFDDPADREAVRNMGRVLYDLAVETTRNLGGESMTRVELRAVAADLRYTGGYLLHVIRRAAKVAPHSPPIRPISAEPLLSRLSERCLNA